MQELNTVALAEFGNQSYIIAKKMKNPKPVFAWDVVTILDPSNTFAKQATIHDIQQQFMSKK